MQKQWINVLMVGMAISLPVILSGAWKGEFLLNHHLYLINLAVILLVARRHFPSFFNLRKQKMSASDWIKGFLSLVLVILLLSLIAISMHGELPGSNLRF